MTSKRKERCQHIVARHEGSNWFQTECAGPAFIAIQAAGELLWRQVCYKHVSPEILEHIPLDGIRFVRRVGGSR